MNAQSINQSIKQSIELASLHKIKSHLPSPFFFVLSPLPATVTGRRQSSCFFPFRVPCIPLPSALIITTAAMHSSSSVNFISDSDDIVLCCTYKICLLQARSFVPNQLSHRMAAHAAVPKSKGRHRCRCQVRRFISVHAVYVY